MSSECFPNSRMIETMVEAKRTYVLGMLISLLKLSPMDASVVAGQMTTEATSFSAKLISGTLIMKDKAGGSSSQDLMNRFSSLMRQITDVLFVYSVSRDSLKTLEVEDVARFRIGMNRIAFGLS